LPIVVLPAPVTPMSTRIIGLLGHGLLYVVNY
jgi:hypothetical protein